MLLSEFIISLQENLENFGDKPVLIQKGKTGYGIDNITNDNIFIYIKI